MWYSFYRFQRVCESYRRIILIPGHGKYIEIYKCLSNLSGESRRISQLMFRCSKPKPHILPVFFLPCCFLLDFYIYRKDLGLC